MLVNANAELNAAGLGHGDVAVVCTVYVLLLLLLRH
jgi:hypothetical protein